MLKKIKKNLFDSIKEPLVMGVLNITPDSFYDGGKYLKVREAIKQINKMIDEGVDIIDVGAFSSRPFSKEISLDEEKKRLFPILKKLVKNYSKTLISIDTCRKEIAESSLNLGASIINDISGGEYDKSMFKFIAKNNVPYILMHMRENPSTMQTNIKYHDFEKSIIKFFKNKSSELKSLGHTNLIIDPGFGFGKKINQNFKLINLIPKLKKINQHVLVGLSRKSMIYKTIGASPEKSLNATSILNTICILKGANILRVHDVKEAKEVIKMINLVKNNI